VSERASIWRIIARKGNGAGRAQGDTLPRPRGSGFRTRGRLEQGAGALEARPAISGGRVPSAYGTRFPNSGSPDEGRPFDGLARVRRGPPVPGFSVIASAAIPIGASQQSATRPISTRVRLRGYSEKAEVLGVPRLAIRSTTSRHDACSIAEDATSAPTSSGHNDPNAYRRLVPLADVSRCSKKHSSRSPHRRAVGDVKAR
jgi:hypothetical protein